MVLAGAVVRRQRERLHQLQPARILRRGAQLRLRRVHLRLERGRTRGRVVAAHVKGAVASARRGRHHRRVWPALAREVRAAVAREVERYRIGALARAAEVRKVRRLVVHVEIAVALADRDRDRAPPVGARQCEVGQPCAGRKANAGGWEGSTRGRERAQSRSPTSTGIAPSPSKSAQSRRAPSAAAQSANSTTW
eukprot:3340831-Prymnesium_polylepis.2